MSFKTNLDYTVNLSSKDEREGWERSEKKAKGKSGAGKERRTGQIDCLEFNNYLFDDTKAYLLGAIGLETLILHSTLVFSPVLQPSDFDM